MAPIQRSLFLAHLPLALLILASTSSAAGQADPISCVLIDTLSLPNSALDALMRESQALFASAGVRTAWRRSRTDVAESDGDNLVIVLPEPPGAHPACTLGAVPGEGHESQAGWVYAGPIARTLGLTLANRSSWTSFEWADFGRALGRVSAHELIHVFLPHLPHSRSGLMRASLGTDELVRGKPRVDDSTRAALQDWFTSASLRAQGDGGWARAGGRRGDVLFYP